LGRSRHTCPWTSRAYERVKFLPRRQPLFALLGRFHLGWRPALLGFARSAFGRPFMRSVGYFLLIAEFKCNGSGVGAGLLPRYNMPCRRTTLVTVSRGLIRHVVDTAGCQTFQGCPDTPRWNSMVRAFFAFFGPSDVLAFSAWTREDRIIPGGTDFSFVDPVHVLNLCFQFFLLDINA